MKFILFLSSTLLFALLSGAQFPPNRFLKKRFMRVNGRRMAYVEVGKGDPIVFLHGNPTSSFLWRNILPHLEGQGRLIAPDLIGMGSSEKLPVGDPSRYIVQQHANFLFKLLEKLGAKERVTLVIHDWGSFLGFLWAYRNRFNPKAIKGIAFFEAIVTPFTSESRPDLAEFFQPLRSEAGEQLVINENRFIEDFLPMGIIRNLSRREMNVYRRPFRKFKQSRLPLLTFSRQVPLDGEPEDIVKVVNDYSAWLKTAQFPKLLIVGNPGQVLLGDELKVARSWPNLTQGTVRGLHFLQEDSPDEIGRMISDWVRNI